MTNKEQETDFEIVGKIVSLLKDLDRKNQIHILKTVNMWLKITDYHAFYEETLPTQTAISPFSQSIQDMAPKFSEREDISPKDFLMLKDFKTDVEKVACLAYYLGHYRNTPHFKTLDISKLNTEAAQLKFTNPAQAVKNAAISGLIAPVSRGKKQLSAMGEKFVQALPDRKQAMTFLKQKRKKRTTRINKNNSK
jgi:hypothetical protein